MSVVCARLQNDLSRSPADSLRFYRSAVLSSANNDSCNFLSFPCSPAGVTLLTSVLVSDLYGNACGSLECH